MAPAERDLSKLPKWAREEILHLRRDLEHWKDRCRIGPEESNTFADPYSDAPTPLGFGTSILFRPRPEAGTHADSLKVRLDERGDLEVNGDDSIMIFPRASNSVLIRLGRRV